MLSSARQGALRAPRLAAVIPLPAESSRQAQVRAMMPFSATPGQGRRVYSAAVLLASDGNSPDNEVELPTDACSSRARTSPSQSQSPAHPSSHLQPLGQPGFKPPTPSPRGPIIPVDSPLTPGERFARLVKVDSFGALRFLGAMSRQDLSTVDIKDIRNLLYWAQQDVGASPHVYQRISRDEATESLRVVRAFLFAQPSRRNAALRDALLGKHMHGRALRAFLRLAINLGCTRLVTETFSERLDEQVRVGHNIIDLEGFVMDLAVAKEWTLLVDLVPGPSDRLPPNVWTPNMVSNVMRANLILKRPQSAVDLFLAVDHPAPVADAWCSLVQAYLETGDIPAAQEAAKAAYEASVPYREIQLAVLRGYRMLGHDEHVEERVRRGMDQLGIALEAPLLNAFLRLRLDVNDVAGAEKILDEFQLFGRASGIAPNVTTAILAITIFMRKQNGALDEQACVELWNGIVQAGGLVSDTTVAHLCRTLDRAGHAEEAIAIFEAAVRGGETRWTLPLDFKPGIVLANTVMEISLRLQRYDGLIRVGGLMREAGINPDKRTVINVLEFASQNLVSSPVSLAHLLRELNARAGTQATSDQINVIVMEAIRVGLRNPESVTQWITPTVGTGDSPEGGSLELRGDLRKLLENQVELLKKSKHTTGRSLRTRLMYDALAVGDAPANRSIRATWQAFVLRGYRPSAKHYLSLMRAYVQIGAVHDAEEVIRIATDEGIVPLPAMYTTLIAAHGHKGNVARAQLWYDALCRISGPDAPALCAILQTYTFNGHARRAVEVACKDYGKVLVTESVVVSVAHALRVNKDIPAAIFFIEHHAKRRDDASEHSEAGPQTIHQVVSHIPTPIPADVEYILTPRLLSLVRKMVNYLNKQDVEALDDRTKLAFQIAQRMMANDKAARPATLRAPPRLNGKNRRLLVDKITDAAIKDNIVLELAEAKSEDGSDAGTLQG